MIEAEAALAAGNAAGMMTILNGLRSSPQPIATLTAANLSGLAPLADSGTADGRLSLLFREKAF